MLKKKKRRKDIYQNQVFPNMEDWPIHKLSEDRKNFVDEINDFTLDKLLQKPASQISDLVSKTIYLERIRIKEEPWKVDPPKEKQFWSRLRKKHVKKGLDQSEEGRKKLGLPDPSEVETFGEEEFSLAGAMNSAESMENPFEVTESGSKPEES